MTHGRIKATDNFTKTELFKEFFSSLSKRILALRKLRYHLFTLLFTTSKNVEKGQRFRTQSNICGRRFLAVTHFRKKAPSQMFD